MNSHRQRAKRKTTAWQAGSLALVGAAIGLAALPIAKLLGAGEHRKPKASAIETGSSKAEGMSAVTLIKTADILRTLSGQVEVAQGEPTVEPEKGPEAVGSTSEPPPPPPSTWAYTGYMKGPNIKKAIITIGPIEGGLQLMLSEGQEHERTKLKEIHPDHILIDEGGKQQRVDLQTRSLAWDSSPPKRPMPPRGGPGVAPGAVGMSAGATAPPGFATPNAAAMAEAQRRMKAAISPQTPVPPPNMAKEFDQGQRDALMKVMSEPDIPPEERANLLREMGVPVDASPEERQEYLKNMGIDEQTDPKLFEMLKDGGGSK
jgi:hypothetical protein